MNELAELKRRAKQGDAEAMQILRDRGFFKQAKSINSYPLSHSQKRLWLLEQLNNRSSVYTIPGAVQLTGLLDEIRFEQALSQLIQRHESLRTVFQNNGGKPRQIIQADSSFKLTVVDLSNADNAESQLQQLTAKDAEQLFDLTQGPLQRSTLVKLSSHKHVFLFSIHHIVCDQWSLDVMLKDLTSLYQQHPLTPLTLQYKDYAAWQNAQLRSESMQQHYAYWRKKIGGELTVLELPVDFSRPPIMAFDGNTFTFVIKQDLLNPFKQLAQKYNASLFMALTTLVKILLHRYSGETDISVGSPVSGRDHPDLENQIGFYVNMLMLRDQIDSTACFSTLLKQVKQTVEEAYEHQHIPFDKLVSEFDSNRDLSRSPLFDVVISMQNSVTEILRFGELELSEFEQASAIAKYDLTFDFINLEDRLLIGINYRTDLFAVSTIQRMSEHFYNLFDAVIKIPEKPVGQIDLLPEKEKKQLLTWNQTKQTLVDATFIELFEQQTITTPNAPALIFEDQTLTYSELNKKANQLAHALIAQQLSAGSLIGLCLKPSADAIVGILGILKAGAAYLPLDPNYPKKRLHFMLADSEAALIVSLSPIRHSLLQQQDNVICLDSDWPEIAKQPQHNPSLFINPKQLAYVIYTSGSTGQPKGVLIEHHSLSNLITALIKAFVITAQSRFLQFSSLSFDASVLEIAPTLSCGACLQLGTDQPFLPNSEFIDLLEQQSISHVLLPPSFLKVLPYKPLTKLTTLIVGGEACDIELVNTWAVNRLFINAYGPTEATVCSSLMVCLPNATTTPSIGQPLINANIHILDGNNQPVPIGIVGELCISGAGLARAYLNRVELTATKFIEVELFSESQRIYKTGDLAKWGSDGSIYYKGRIDEQVKLRGFRIELGEIASHLNQFKAIKESEVIVFDHDKTGQQLFAFIVVKDGQHCDAKQIRAYLKGFCPDFMLPSSYIPLKALPLTVNGKVDRKALQQHITQYFQNKDPQGISPQTEAEQQIAAIWSDILAKDTISVTDNFFELGGHSLLATQIIAQLQLKMAVKISLRQLFQNPTIAELALLFKEAKPSSVTPIPVSAKAKHYPLSPSQNRLWILDKIGVDMAAYNMVGATLLEGTINIPALQQAFKMLIMRHQSLHTYFVEVDGVAKQVIHSDQQCAIEIVDLSSEAYPEQTAQDSINDDASIAFKLTEHALLRCKLYLLSAERYVFVLNLHHIISDGWSLDIFFKELITTYHGGTLAPLRIHYKDYAFWLNNKLSDKKIYPSRKYWQNKLGGVIPVLELPSDYSRPAIQSFKGESLGFVLTLDETHNFRSLCQNQGASLFMGLLALVKILLFRYSRQSDIIVGSTIAGRNHPDTHEQIGFFVNMLALRDTLQANDCFVTVLNNVKQTVNDAFEHQDYPFDSIIEELALPREMSRNPLFDVAVTMLQATENNWPKLDKLSMSEFYYQNKTSKFDLTFAFTEAQNRGCLVGIEYNTDLFSSARMERLLEHFQTLLQSILLDAKMAIETLPMLPDHQRDQLLTGFNQTQRDYPKTLGIAALFAQQAAQSPDDLAVIFDDKFLTYQQLNQYANGIADQLKHQYSVCHGDCIGVYLERSELTIIALLGILKAGAAYVPIDPDYPQKRIDFIIQDTACRVIISDKRHSQKIIAQDGEHEPQQFIINHDLLTTIDQNPEVIGNGESLAYVIYTSGSSGQPKGVMIRQKSISRLVLNTNYITIESCDCILQTGSLAFDASTFEIWGALLNGASIYLSNKETLLDLAETKQLIEDADITILWLTASLFNQWVDVDCSIFGNLKTILVGGEKLSAPHINKVRREHPQISVINGYGPTENTTFTACYHIESDYQNEIPIGSPIANTRIFILDPSSQLVPIGIPGELYTGGDGVAKGYLNQPDLTAEKFVSNPFDKSDTLYRTGDLARWRDDGAIEFIGRNDNQVKVRGFRIELGEIETNLMLHAEVQQAVVIAFMNTVGTQELAAYVVGSASLETNELTTFLRRSLPAHMIPAQLVKLDNLPLTINGKVDTRALPSLLANSSNTAEIIAPRNEAETVLLTIWRTVLNRERLGISDHFFENGGDSIKAIQISSRLIAQGWQMTVADLFTHPTVTALAPHISLNDLIQQDQSLVQGTIPLTAIQHWFFQQAANAESKAHFNQAVLLKSISRIDIAALKQTLLALQTHHDALRMTFTDASEIIQNNAGLNYPISIESVNLTSSAEAETVMLQHANKTHSSFELDQGPLLKTVLYQLPQDDRLLLVIHHLVVDGISWRILLEDLELAYQQTLSGKPVKLATKTLSFKDWALAINDYSNSKNLQQETPYWLEQIRLAEHTRPLPQDSHYPNNCFNDIESQSFSLSKEQTEALLTQTHHTYHTEINDLLLTALATALQQWHGGSSLVTLEGHGREPLQQALDVSRTVGWFTSLFPFILNLDGDNIGDHIKQIKEALRAVPNKGMGYGLLKYLGKMPELQTLDYEPALSFNYLGQFEQSESIDNLLHFADEPSGQAIHQAFPRQHALDISAMIVQDQFQLTVYFNPGLHQAETIFNVTENIQHALIDIISHCKAHSLSEKTPADFSLVPFTLASYCEFLSHEQLNAEDIDDIYPLSPMQQGLLFESLYQRQDNSYMIQTRYQLNGDLNQQIFSQSWHQLCQRHAILRTAFVHDQLQQPLQIVFKKHAPFLQYFDLTALTPEQQKSRCDDVISQDFQQGFDLGHHSLMRVSILQLTATHSQIIWSYHHIILDGWCLGIIYKDLIAIYTALLQQLKLPPLPSTDYANYIVWLNAQNPQQALDFWQQYLSNYEQLATLPKLKTADPEHAIEHSDCYFELANTKAITLLCNRLGVTLNTLIQCVWGILLSRYNNTRDVVFGAIVSGRPPTLTGAEQILGLFINVIPVRICYDQQQSFIDLLQQLQTTALTSESYHYLPLTEIQNLSDIALFDHLMIFENYPLSKVAEQQQKNSAVDWSIDDVQVHDRTHYDFDITVIPGECLSMVFSFNAQVYSQQQIKQTQHHFLTLLDDLINSPDQALTQAKILTKAELQLLDNFNHTSLSYCNDQTIVALFEQQVSCRPGHIAVSFAGQSLSYQQLNSQANQIAHYLINTGVSPEQRVGLCIERSLDMIIAVWAILKSGAAYVPLDPILPHQRLYYMLDDANISLILCQKRRAPTFPNTVTLLDLDGDFNSYPAINPPLQAQARQLAYVIYTSGSTGQPKGVMVEHGNLMHIAFAWRHAYQLSSFEIRLLQMANVSFDVFAGDLIRALCHGGHLVICPFDSMLDPQALYSLLSQYRINILESTPGLLVPLMDHISEHKLAVDFLNLLIIGSDVLTVHDFQRLSSSFGNQLRLINSYGLTEATIDSSFFEGQLPTYLQSPSTPIGKPLANTQYYIFDAEYQLVPIGVFGELYIGGSGVARGYVKLDALTAERFVQHPTLTKQRLYKTGDMVRWLPDGNVEFKQRTDNQVKIRGFRVELAEIEKQLLSHPLVDKVVVLVKSNLEHTQQLIAYLVTSKTCKNHELRDYLLLRLPEYMLPQFFVPLKTLPLTTHGKIDKKALPEPESDNLALAHNFVSPRNSIESQLTVLWQNILQIKNIGIFDNFFELGGHSLKAMQLMSRIHQQFNVKLELRMLFNAPTIAEQALQLNDGESSQFSPITAAPEQAYYPLSHAQERLFLLHRLSDNGGIAYNMPAAFSVRIKPDLTILNRAFTALIARHEMLRTGFVEYQGDAKQKIHSAFKFSVSEIVLHATDNTEQALQQLITEETQIPFDLQSPPLLRAKLITIASDNYVFLLNMHHIIGDGWSENVLYRELIALYTAFQDDRKNPLSPLSIQYKDYVVWQQAKGFKKEQHYWLQVLKNMPPRLKLQYDFPETEDRNFRGDRVSIKLDKEFTQKLRNLALEKQTTVSNILLAVFKLLLFQLLRQPDFCIGISIANRNHPELENLIGFFINILPIRSQCSADMEFDDLLRQVTDQVEAAFEHQDYPFDLMIQKLNPDRVNNRQPLVNVVYSFQNYHDVHIDIEQAPDAENNSSELDDFQAMDIAFKFAKFDLTLFASDFGDHLQLDLEYDASLFLPATIEHMLTLFKRFTTSLLNS